MTIIHPKNKNIMVKVDKEAEKVTDFGIILPENVNEAKAESAVVLGVDPEVTLVKEGDTIYFKSYSLSEVQIGKENYGFLKEEDVIAVQE